MTPTLRFVAPHLVPVHDIYAAPSIRYWTAAFTSQGTKFHRLARYLHRCRFSEPHDEQKKSSAVKWQLESQLLSSTSPMRATITEGDAPDLSSAGRMVLSTVSQHHGVLDTDGDFVLAPAFVALPTLPHHPRIWAGGAEIENSKPPELQSFRRLCFIRERFHGITSTYSCSLEALEQDNSRLLKHWTCDNLQIASQSGCEALLDNIA